MSKIAEAAKAWVGREFNPGMPEQCMAFVRHVLREAGSPLADRVTAAPVDRLGTGLALASSLAGRDLGYPLLGPEAPDLPAGAILFWANTYGNWDPGTITHVGIYIGGGEFVHRPTMSRPVEKASLSGYWRQQLRCSLLVKDPEPVPAAPKPVDNTHPVELLSVEFVVRTAEGKLLKLFHNARGTNLVGEL